MTRVSSIFTLWLYIILDVKMIVMFTLETHEAGNHKRSIGQERNSFFFFMSLLIHWFGLDVEWTRFVSVRDTILASRSTLVSSLSITSSQDYPDAAGSTQSCLLHDQCGISRWYLRSRMTRKESPPSFSLSLSGLCCWRDVGVKNKNFSSSSLTSFFFLWRNYWGSHFIGH